MSVQFPINYKMIYYVDILDLFFQITFNIFLAPLSIPLWAKPSRKGSSSHTMSEMASARLNVPLKEKPIEKIPGPEEMPLLICFKFKGNNWSPDNENERLDFGVPQKSKFGTVVVPGVMKPCEQNIFAILWRWKNKDLNHIFPTLPGTERIPLN